MHIRWSEEERKQIAREIAMNHLGLPLLNGLRNAVATLPESRRRAILTITPFPWLKPYVAAAKKELDEAVSKENALKSASQKHKDQIRAEVLNSLTAVEALSVMDKILRSWLGDIVRTELSKMVDNGTLQQFARTEVNRPREATKPPPEPTPTPTPTSTLLTEVESTPEPLEKSVVKSETPTPEVTPTATPPATAASFIRPNGHFSDSVATRRKKFFIVGLLGSQLEELRRQFRTLEIESVTADHLHSLRTLPKADHYILMVKFSDSSTEASLKQKLPSGAPFIRHPNGLSSLREKISSLIH